ncbi:type II toxin-antitoxin system HicA family toxin [Patescibacteria group bacterium]|nr:type II toxin-antitoxin system HicA family toxin [Patescibacteria group bacterium]
MPKVPPIKRKEFVRKLKALGFDGPFAGGKHEFLRRNDGLKITIPNPHQKEISGVLQKIILTQADISVEEFLKI